MIVHFFLLFFISNYNQWAFPFFESRFIDPKTYESIPTREKITILREQLEKARTSIKKNKNIEHVAQLKDLFEQELGGKKYEEKINLLKTEQLNKTEIESFQKVLQETKSFLEKEAEQALQEYQAGLTRVAILPKRPRLPIISSLEPKNPREAIRLNDEYNKLLEEFRPDIMLFVLERGETVADLTELQMLDRLKSRAKTSAQQVSIQRLIDAKKALNSKEVKSLLTKGNYIVQEWFPAFMKQSARGLKIMQRDISKAVERLSNERTLLVNIIQSRPVADQAIFNHLFNQIALLNLINLKAITVSSDLRKIVAQEIIKNIIDITYAIDLYKEQIQIKGTMTMAERTKIKELDAFREKLIDNFEPFRTKLKEWAFLTDDAIKEIEAKEKESVARMQLAPVTPSPTTDIEQQVTSKAKTIITQSPTLNQALAQLEMTFPKDTEESRYLIANPEIEAIFKTKFGLYHDEILEITDSIAQLKGLFQLYQTTTPEQKILQGIPTYAKPEERPILFIKGLHDSASVNAQKNIESLIFDQLGMSYEELLKKLTPEKGTVQPARKVSSQLTEQQKKQIATLFTEQINPFKAIDSLESEFPFAIDATMNDSYTQTEFAKKFKIPLLDAITIKQTIESKDNAAIIHNELIDKYYNLSKSIQAWIDALLRSVGFKNSYKEIAP